MHERFEGAVGLAPLTLVVAPPGYGKTTALAAWADGRPGQTIWLVLTRSEGDPAQQFHIGLLSALSIALDTPYLPHIDPLWSTTAVGGNVWVDMLASAAESWPEPVVVVVDDAQFADRAAITATVTSLIERSRSRLRFVLSGTGDIDSWFNRQIVTGAASAVRSGELAMTADEIDEAYTSASEGKAISDLARSVHIATRGWPVAVRLALLAAETEGTAISTSMAGAQDDPLTGYIVDTVVRQLRPELSDFVLDATTCSRLDADLAEALSGNPHSAALLEECVRRGLFIDRHVHGDVTVYRWHEVFARHCRIAVRREDAARAERADLAAAVWLAARFPIEATVHAMQAGAAELAAEIIRGSWLQLVIDADAGALAARCLALPDELADLPEFLLIRACCLDVCGDAAGAAMLRTRAGLARPESPSAALTRSISELFLAHDHSMLSRSADEVRGALSSDAVPYRMRSHVLFLLGWVELRLRRDPRLAVDFLSTAWNEATAVGHAVLARRAAGNVAFALAFSGRFTAARRAVARADAVEDDPEWRGDGGIERFAQGFVDYWQDEIPSALECFRALARPGEHETYYARLARLYLALSVAAARDTTAVAEAEFHLSQVIGAEEHGVPWLVYRKVAAAELAAVVGDTDRVLALIDGVADTPNVPVTAVHVADLYRRLDRPLDAARALRTLGVGAAPFVQVDALVLSAALQWAGGDRNRAHLELERALDTAQPEGIARPFARPDEPMRAFLAEHAAWGTRHEHFLARRLAASAPESSRHPVPASTALTARERDVLGYLHTRMTAAEIAAELFVSVNTVRTHQRSIYRKLGVTSRREAVRHRP